MAFPFLALTDSLTAQGISTTFVTATKMKVSASAMVFYQPCWRGITKTVPANTDLTKGLDLRTTKCIATASTTVTFDQSQTNILATIKEKGWTYSHPSAVSTGPHETLLTFKTTTPVKAILVLTAFSSGSGSSGYSASVDIGNNAKTDFVGQFGKRVTKEFAVTITSKGLVVKTRTGGSGIYILGPATFSGTLTIQLIPAFCTLSYYGKTCVPALLGPALLGMPTFKHELELGLVNAAANTFGYLIIGLKQLSIRIPGTFCFLNTDIVIQLPFTTNIFGKAVHRLAVPPGLQLTFNLQDVLFQRQGNRFIITSTNGLRVNCK